MAGAAILVWFLTGPLFHFSDTWQLIVNTGTTVLTFLMVFVMVFVIQATQIRDSTALHVKLDELIAVTSGASDRAIGIERAKEAEIDRMRNDLEDRVAAAGDKDGRPAEGVEDAQLPARDSALDVLGADVNRCALPAAWF